MLKIFKSLVLTIGITNSLVCNADKIGDDSIFTVTTISKNVYSIIAPSYGRPSPENKAWNSNSHFIVTRDGVLVFDTGSSKLIGQEILNAIKQTTDKPVRWIVNSHSHADHWLGNAAFEEMNVEIIASSIAINAMEKNGKIDVAAFSRMTEGATGNSTIVYPNSTIQGHKKRIFGGVEVEFITANDAHSQGDILLWLPKQKIIFGGDVLNSDWMPIMTPNGNVQHLIDTLNTIVKLAPSTVLVGHGQSTSVESVIRDRDLLINVWHQVQKAFQHGKQVNEVVSLIDTKISEQYKKRYKDFDTNLAYFVTMIYNKQKE